MTTTLHVYDFTRGDKDQKELPGGKGDNLAEITRLGLPAPLWFTNTTGAQGAPGPGSEPGELRVQVTTALRQLEDNLGRRLGPGTTRCWSVSAQERDSRCSTLA